MRHPLSLSPFFVAYVLMFAALSLGSCSHREVAYRPPPPMVEEVTVLGVIEEPLTPDPLVDASGTDTSAVARARRGPASTTTNSNAAVVEAPVDRAPASIMAEPPSRARSSSWLSFLSGVVVGGLGTYGATRMRRDSRPIPVRR